MENKSALNSQGTSPNQPSNKKMSEGDKNEKPGKKENDSSILASIIDEKISSSNISKPQSRDNEDVRMPSEFSRRPS